MRLFEEFENDLQDANTVKDLFKAMLANGISSIDDAHGISFCISEFGLIQNVPQDLWKVESVGLFDSTITVDYDGMTIGCYVCNKEDFEKRTGFKFPTEEVE